MSARGEVGVEIVETGERDAYVSRYVSARLPRWLMVAARARGHHDALTAAVNNTSARLHSGEVEAAQRWARVADALALAIAHETRDDEIELDAPPPRPTAVGAGPSSDGLPMTGVRS